MISRVPVSVSTKVILVELFLRNNFAFVEFEVKSFLIRFLFDSCHRIIELNIHKETSSSIILEKQNGRHGLVTGIPGSVLAPPPTSILRK